MGAQINPYSGVGVIGGIVGEEGAIPVLPAIKVLTRPYDGPPQIALGLALRDSFQNCHELIVPFQTVERGGAATKYFHILCVPVHRRRRGLLEFRIALLCLQQLEEDHKRPASPRLRTLPPRAPEETLGGARKIHAGIDMAQHVVCLFTQMAGVPLIHR
jgi:hypothetical protein